MGKIVHLSDERVTLPNGVEVEYQFVHHPGGAGVVALNEKGEVCLLRHYRPVADGWLWEVPAGKRDDEEEPLITAKRELQEETGFTASRWKDLGAVYSSPGIFKEVVHLYLATDLKHIGSQPEEDEVFEIHWIALEEAVAMAQDGRLCDGKSIIAVLRTNALL